MKTPEYNIEIGRDGKVRVEVRGAQGQLCMDLADLIRDIIGEEQSRQKTAEYYSNDGAVRIQGMLHGRVRERP
jgi:Protein of unknown function (DUF2997)